MANSLYDKAREAYLTGTLNWSSDNIKVLLVNTTSYTVSLTTHQYKTDVAGGAIVATSSNLTTKTTTAGAAGADNVTFSTVSGSTVGAIIIYKDTGTDSTSPLIAYIDTATGLPIVPNGGDIILTWDTGTNKIFRL